ncbi:MAG: hypothetical protein N4A74_25310, partial [Carboxylicivirga sp.]|nr:hypothetical protein [Carboxylicivirga sp.]
MKKIMLFMAHPTNDMEDDLTVLGRLGLMHISPFQPAKDESIERVQKRIEQLEKAIAILDESEALDATASVKLNDYTNVERGEIALLEKVLDTNSANNDLQKQIAELSKAKQWYDSWGSISLADIQ